MFRAGRALGARSGVVGGDRIRPRLDEDLASQRDQAHQDERGDELEPDRGIEETQNDDGSQQRQGELGQPREEPHLQR